MPRLRTSLLVLLAPALIACQQSGTQTSTGADPTRLPVATSAASGTAGTTSAAPSSAPSAEPTTAERNGAELALFFGDSYFVGGGYTDANHSMAAIAARRLGWRSIVRGGGGTGFVAGNVEYGIANFIGQIRSGALDVGDAGQVSWLVIEGGGNDKDDRPALIQRRAGQVLRAAARRHPEARLVLVGTLDPTVDGFTDTDGVIGALQRAADAAGVPYINAQRWLEGRPDLVGPDYDHPTAQGHRVVGRKLAKALDALR